MPGRAQHVDNTPAARTTGSIVQRCQQCRHKSSGDEDLCYACRVMLISTNLLTLRSLSDNSEINDFIEEANAEAIDHLGLYKWIPFDEFSQVRHIANGGFGSVYHAIWYYGDYKFASEDERSSRLSNAIEVALKSLKNSRNITKDFLNEITAHRRCGRSPRVVHCYGITRDPKTGDYVIVMPFAQHGDLRQYVRKRTLSWEERLEILRDISEGLRDMHKNSIVHCDLHSGNILHFEDVERPGKSKVKISDLGMCRPVSSVSKTDSKKQIYGVMPFMAPELFTSGYHSTASDIYGFGGIMYELLTRATPFNNRTRDSRLAFDIYYGVHPETPPSAPKCYDELMKQCWDTDPQYRPTAEKLHWTFSQWLAILTLAKFSRNNATLRKFGYSDGRVDKEVGNAVESPFLTSQPVTFENELCTQNLGIRVAKNRRDSAFEELYETQQNDLALSSQDVSAFFETWI